MEAQNMHISYLYPVSHGYTAQTYHLAYAILGAVTGMVVMLARRQLYLAQSKTERSFESINLIVGVIVYAILATTCYVVPEWLGFWFVILGLAAATAMLLVTGRDLKDASRIITIVPVRQRSTIAS